MCGIAGIIVPQGSAIKVDDARILSQQMYHRGPDDEGFLGWRRGDVAPDISRQPEEALGKSEVAFVHRRLSIIDTSEGGWQPMGDRSGRLFITFNGEIYNYLELKEDLEKLGCVFRSSSDTEVLLQSLLQWGLVDTLKKLTGMFAFALLDTKENTIALARDPFGIKPLSYTECGSGVAFASEITSLLGLAEARRSIHADALFDYLRFGFTDRGGRTLFRDMHHLPPAHYAIIDLDNVQDIRPVRYWQTTLNNTVDLSFDEAATRLKELFFESVRLHLRADVPVGAALSGGIDSSAVVMAMRHLEGDKLDLHAFSFIAPEDKANEEHWIEMAGAAAQASVYKTAPGGSELSGDIDALIKTQGEPFGSTSIYAQSKVFELAKQNGIKVTLDGQGADEILAGYVPFIGARLASLMKQGRLLKAGRLLRGSGNASSAIPRAMRFILPGGLQTCARKLIGEELVPDWMNGAWFQARDVRMAAPQHAVAGDVLRHELNESLTDRVLPSLLRYQDRNSMAHSVESRVPFLTTKLVDFLYSLPENFLISDDGVTKSVFREAMRDHVPAQILERRDKIGFVTPEARWLKEDTAWADQILARDPLRSIGALNSDVVKSEIESARAGRKPISAPVWRWINLTRWAELFEVDFAN